MEEKKRKSICGFDHRQHPHQTLLKTQRGNQVVSDALNAGVHRNLSILQPGEYLSLGKNDKKREIYNIKFSKSVVSFSLFDTIKVKIDLRSRYGNDHEKSLIKSKDNNEPEVKQTSSLPPFYRTLRTHKMNT